MAQVGPHEGPPLFTAILLLCFPVPKSDIFDTHLENAKGASTSCQCVRYELGVLIPVHFVFDPQPQLYLQQFSCFASQYSCIYILSMCAIRAGCLNTSAFCL
jgi:hypothetical protein